MTRTDHRRELFLPNRAIVALNAIGIAVRAKPLATGIGQRGIDAAIGNRGRHRIRVAVLDAVRAKCARHPPRAQPSALHRRRSRLGKSPIVDIAKIGEPLRQGIGIRRRARAVGPAALAQLATQILAQPSAGRRESLDIMQRKTLQRRSIERLRHAFFRLFSTTVFGHAIIVPHWDRILNATACVRAPKRGVACEVTGVECPKTGRDGTDRTQMTIDTSRAMTTDPLAKPAIDRAAPNVTATPTEDALPRRLADFATLGDALDYAASGTRGLNFHDARGTLAQPYPYAQLQRDARKMADRLIAAGVAPKDRIALVAETGAEFAALFFGVVYAGAWPVPLPLPTSFGGRVSYIEQLRVQLSSCDPKMLIYPPELAQMASEAARLADTIGVDWSEFATRDAPEAALPEARSDDIAYLQYSSGSTRFPHGVVITHEALLNNLAAHSHGMEICATDRCVSWLPWYHDMGLVGCFLSPIANQVSTDYLKTEDFARRPLAWLDLVSRNTGTTLSYSPTFGYDICARRMSSQTKASERFDLSRWRVAGNGADMIRPDVMQSFVDAFADAGFKASAFLPSYGLAEATLAVSLMPPGEGIRVELVEETQLSGGSRGEDRPQRYRAIVNCGKPVRDMRIEIREEDGTPLPERAIGKVWCKGKSVMVGYFRDDAATDACMADGWLDTGDMGYMSDGYIYIVGRAKDMIIVNGKNHWPQDIEWAVEQLPGFKAGDIAAFAITTPGGEETPAVLVQCRSSDEGERLRLRDEIRERVRSVTGMNCVIELIPPRTLPRTSSGKLSRAKARNLYLSGDIKPYDIAA